MTGAEARRLRSTALWTRVSRMYRRSHPNCELCLPASIVRSEEVDHIVPLTEGGEPFDEDNLRALCRPCHQSVTRHGGRPPAPNRVTVDGFRNPEYDRWKERCRIASAIAKQPGRDGS